MNIEFFSKLSKQQQLDELYISIQLKYDKFIYSLIDMKQNLNIVDTHNRNILCYAIYFDNIKLSKYIITNNIVDLNILQDNNCPLSTAIFKQSDSIILYLLEHKVDPNIINNNKQKNHNLLLDYVFHRPNKLLLDYLIEKINHKLNMSQPQILQLNYLRKISSIEFYFLYLIEEDGNLHKIISYYDQHSSDIIDYNLGELLFTSISLKRYNVATWLLNTLKQLDVNHHSIKKALDVAIQHGKQHNIIRKLISFGVVFSSEEFIRNVNAIKFNIFCEIIDRKLMTKIVDGYTILFICKKSKYIEYLLGFDSNVNIKGGPSERNIITYHLQSEKLTKLFIKHGCDVNAKDINGMTVVEYSLAENGSSLKLLIDNNADINITTNKDTSILSNELDKCLSGKSLTALNKLLTFTDILEFTLKDVNNIFKLNKRKKLGVDLLKKVSYKFNKQLINCIKNSCIGDIFPVDGGHEQGLLGLIADYANVYK